MTSSRPYLLRSLYEWILDNDCTPYVVVNAWLDNVMVPQEYVKDGQIVLNISPVAVQGLVMTNEALEFNGRFGGMPTPVHVPVEAVMGIYARENGQGMVFETGKPDPESPPPVQGDGGTGKDGGDGSESGGRKSGGKGRKPSLRVVK
ncbi:MAG: ClpXP protease specificity-enhancing factor [Pseudomonadota bacterium]